MLVNLKVKLSKEVFHQRDTEYQKSHLRNERWYIRLKYQLNKILRDFSIDLTKPHSVALTNILLASDVTTPLCRNESSISKETLSLYIFPQIYLYQNHYQFGCIGAP